MLPIKSNMNRECVTPFGRVPKGLPFCQFLIKKSLQVSNFVYSGRELVPPRTSGIIKKQVCDHSNNLQFL